MPNASVLEQKKAVVVELVEKLKAAQAGILVDYRGLTVEEDTKLRAKLREAGINIDEGMDFVFCGNIPNQQRSNHFPASIRSSLPLV